MGGCGRRPATASKRTCRVVGRCVSVISVVDDVDVGGGGCCTVASSINGSIGAISDGVGIATIVVGCGGDGLAMPLIHRYDGDLDSRFCG